jgi:hypothetical protein
MMCRMLAGAGLRDVTASALTGGVASLYEGILAANGQRRDDEEG